MHSKKQFTTSHLLPKCPKLLKGTSKGSREFSKMSWTISMQFRPKQSSEGNLIWIHLLSSFRTKWGKRYLGPSNVQNPKLYTWSKEPIQVNWFVFSAFLASEGEKDCWPGPFIQRVSWHVREGSMGVYGAPSSCGIHHQELPTGDESIQNPS